MFKILIYQKKKFLLKKYRNPEDGKVIATYNIFLKKKKKRVKKKKKKNVF
jgi:hypothetical protein